MPLPNARLWNLALLAALSLAPIAATGDVVISELMYHPVGEAGRFNNDDYEFIELFNAGPATVDLEGASFTEGIAYTFSSPTLLAPGQYLVVAGNREAFLARYPSVTRLAPEAYTGQLANSGEQVTLVNSGGGRLCGVLYKDGPNWPQWADGHGASLVLAAPGNNPDEPASWCDSAEFNGSPGLAGSCAVRDIVINELLTHTDPPLEDAIELHNTTAAAIDLNGWYLSDSAEDRARYRITNTVIAAGGYAVFYQYQLDNAAHPVNTAFALNSGEGGAVYLTAANPAGTLTRFVDMAEFGPSENGVSFGRYPDGAGALVAQRRLSLGTGVTAQDPPSDLAKFRTGRGAANGLPKVGPVVLSEIHYHPASGNPFDEFVELQNISAAAVPLFDPAHPSNTWKLASAVDLVFPQNLTLQPGQTLIACGTDPQAFRTARGLNANTLVLGPWDGQLNNAGESVRLYKPDPPNTNQVPYILVDQVNYDDQAPWPVEADGDGPSLERLDPTAYGNTAGNWFPGPINGTPGSASATALLDPQLSPNPPAAGTALTVSIRVASGAAPAKVSVRTSINGQTTETLLRDNGTGGDPVANDSRYTATLAGPPADSWLYYKFFTTTAAGATSAVTRWFWTPVGTPPPDVQIHEIMYHPDTDPEEPAEYVELFNPADHATDLSGWTLQGAGASLPAGAVIPARGYLVSAASKAVMLSTYGVPDAVEGWTGRLQNDGETLSLENQFGREVDRVQYSDQAPWPAAADGYGASLERICAAAPGNTPLNWTASAAGTNWQQVCWTGAVGQASAALNLFLDFDGKCWIDDVSVRPVGQSSNLLANGGFEAGLEGWTPAGNHVRSRLAPGLGRSGSSALALVCNETRWIFPDRPDGEKVVSLFGDAASNRVASAPLAVTAGQACEISFWIRRAGLGVSVNAALGSASRTTGLQVRGTPGRANTRVEPGQPAGVLSVQQEFNLCPPGTGNLVRVTAAPLPAIASVTLFYRAVPTNGYRFSDGVYTGLALRDDGLAPDRIAGDGEFAGRLPAFPEGRTLVRYFIAITDTRGTPTRHPQLDDPSLDCAYWVQGAAAQTQLPDWQVLVDGGPELYPLTARACAVSPEGQVFTDILIRQRGNPLGFDPVRSGVALRMHRTRTLDAWFADHQKGINFKMRRNDRQYHHRRILNEVIAYDLQRALNLPAPRERHVCLWINGEPNVTLELEDPEDAFLDGNGISRRDYVTRSTWSGRAPVGGDPAIDNLWTVYHELTTATGADLTAAIRTNLCLEVVLQTRALLALTANYDQNLVWNMFQQRSHTDLRWRDFPWDTDKSFEPDFATLHPYYQTPLHPDAWNPSYTQLLTYVLFAPETGPDAARTLPYRSAHQRTLWRLCHTLFTTNYLFPRIDALQATLLPVYTQLGLAPAPLVDQITEIKNVIRQRRSYLMGATWSDADTNLWLHSAVYDPSQVVINEILYAPNAGEEYVELYNRGAQTIDLGGWELQCAGEHYRIPHGALLAAGSYLTITDSQTQLGQAFPALDNPRAFVRRAPRAPLWDAPGTGTGAVEYITRIVEIPALTLPNKGATLRLWDLCSNLVDQVTYQAEAPWPPAAGTSAELIDPAGDNQAPAAWATCKRKGSPCAVNTVVPDADKDGLPDEWEQQILAASGGAFTNVADILPSADFDHDALDNAGEFARGTNPVNPDSDNDGADDGEEVAAATDPLNFASYPPGTPVLQALLQHANGRVGLWRLGGNGTPLSLSVLLSAPAPWQARDLDGAHLLLQAGTGGIVAHGELDADAKPIPSAWRTLLGSYPGLLLRALDGDVALVQFGDGGAIYAVEFRPDWQPRALHLLSGPIPGVSARSLDDSRVLVQIGGAGGPGFVAAFDSNWTLAGLTRIQNMPGEINLRALAGNLILVQAGLTGATSLWEVDPGSGAILNVRPVSNAMPGWQALSLDVR